MRNEGQGDYPHLGDEQIDCSYYCQRNIKRRVWQGWIWDPGLGSPHHWIFYLTQESASELSDVRWESCAWFLVGSTGLNALGTGHGQGWRGERALVPCKPTPVMPCRFQYRPGTSTLPWAEVCITLILTPGVCRLFLFCPFHRWECRGTERSSILSKVIQLASLKWSELTWSHPRMFSPSQHKERNCFCFQCSYLRWAIITIYPLMAGKLLFESIYHSQAAAPVHSFDFTQTCLPLYTSKGVPLLFIDLGTGLFHERILSTFFSAGFAECLE